MRHMLQSRYDVTARYSRTCMLVHVREHPLGMKLGGTAEADNAPVLSGLVGQELF